MHFVADFAEVMDATQQLEYSGSWVWGSPSSAAGIGGLAILAIWCTSWWCPRFFLGTASGLGLVVIAVQSWSSTRRLALVVCSGWRSEALGYVDWCTEVDQVACEPVEGY